MQFRLRHTAYAVAVMVLCMIVCCSGCFVRNCPPGGKRSMEQMPQSLHAPRQCMRCGPDGLGQCLGPNICCGAAIGCYMNTVEASMCEKENEILTPCEVEGKGCGPTGQGNCVADGVCCDDESCTLDGQCQVGEDIPMSRHSGNYSPELIHRLRRILARRSFSGRK